VRWVGREMWPNVLKRRSSMHTGQGRPQADACASTKCEFEDKFCVCIFCYRGGKMHPYKMYVKIVYIGEDPHFTVYSACFSYS